MIEEEGPILEALGFCLRYAYGSQPCFFINSSKNVQGFCVVAEEADEGHGVCGEHLGCEQLLRRFEHDLLHAAGGLFR
jgi:hypothetical protein